MQWYQRLDPNSKRNTPLNSSSSSGLYRNDAAFFYGPTARRRYLALVPLVELVNQKELFVGALDNFSTLAQFLLVCKTRYSGNRAACAVG